MTLPETHPADSRWQPLKLNTLSRHIQPTVQPGIIRDQFFDFAVGSVNILRVTGQSYPAERSDTTAKKRADISRHKSRKIKRITHPTLQCHLPDIVTVIKCGYSCMMKI